MPTKNIVKVLIIGYGEMGHAMEYLLGPHHDVRVWQRHPKSGASPNLDVSAEWAECILFCVPAQAISSLAEQIKTRIRVDTVLISIAKGLDARGRYAAQILGDVLGESNRLCVLYGPMISEELRAGKPGFAEVGTPNIDVYKAVRSLFSPTPLYLQHCPDLQGLSWSAVMKNVYAMLFGVADGLNLGDNVRGFLASSALDELNRVALENQGRAHTPYRLGGLGDLITTATSAGSHHHALGLALATNTAGQVLGEGPNTLAMITKHRLLDLSRFPLARLMKHIIESPASAQEQFEQFLVQYFQD